MQGSDGDTDIENRWTRGRAGEEEDGTNGESCMETCTLLYVKQVASGNLLYDSGSMGLGHMRAVGWRGRFRREGTHVYHVDIWQKPRL